MSSHFDDATHFSDASASLQTSGCHFRANFRYAFLISSRLALLLGEDQAQRTYVSGWRFAGTL